MESTNRLSFKSVYALYTRRRT